MQNCCPNEKGMKENPEQLELCDDDGNGHHPHNNSSVTSYVNQNLMQQIQNREILGKPIRKPIIFELNKNCSIFQRDLKAHTGCVNAVDFAPSEEWIVSGGDDLKVRLWKTVDCCTSENPASSSFTMKSIHHSNIFALRFSHKTERIYSAGNDHRLLVHDIRTRERLRTYRASSSIYHIAIHPSDDNMIAASSDDRNVYLFDLRGNEGDGLCTKLRQEGCAYSVCWNPQNHNLVAVCNESTGLLVYDLRMGNNNYVEAGKLTKKAICADWSPTGDQLFCAVSRSNPILFDLTTSKHLQLCDPNYSNFCTIKSCSFAGHDYMLTGSDDWNIYVWKMPAKWLEAGEQEEEAQIERAYTVLKGHRSIVNHVKFGERSNLLLSCGVEKIVKCWAPLPFTAAYKDPKHRERLSNRRLFPLLEMLGDGNESDTEEDLSTLHRFDYYFESLRAQQENGGTDSDSEDSVMDIFMFRANENHSEEGGEERESFFSEVTTSTTPSSIPHSPSATGSPASMAEEETAANIVESTKTTTDNQMSQ